MFAPRPCLCTHGTVQALGLSVQVVRQRLIRLLLEREHDVRAEEQLLLLRDSRAVAPVMLSVAQARVAIVIEHLRRNPKFAANLATLSASTIRWVCATRPAHRVQGGGNRKAGTFGRDSSGRIPSLQRAHNLCRLALSLLEPGGAEHKRCAELVELTQKLLSQFRNQMVDV